MTRKQLEKKIEEAKFSLGMARHARTGYFPHPHWEEDEKRLEAEIKKLETQLQEMKNAGKQKG